MENFTLIYKDGVPASGGKQQKKVCFWYCGTARAVPPPGSYSLAVSSVICNFVSLKRGMQQDANTQPRQSHSGVRKGRGRTRTFLNA
jgi:hypothetical protein